MRKKAKGGVEVFSLRLPEDLKKQLEKAVEDRRKETGLPYSINSLIIDALRRVFQKDKKNV